MDFFALEDQDAIRFSWNILPSSKHMAQKAVVPVGALYTPMKDLANLALVEYEPLKCKCQTILNPYCQINYQNKSWLCPICNQFNAFPGHYAEYISENNLPAELLPEYSTIEYIQTEQPTQPNIFLFLIDKCMPQEELDAIRDSILQIINLLSPDTLIGLITFDRFVFVHEVGFADCNKSYAFKGNRDYTSQQIYEMLGLHVTGKHDPRGVVPQITSNKFIQPLSQCENSLTNILQDLQPDPWIVPNDQRQQRATGNALNIALSLLEATSHSGSRLFLFVHGPCTIGQGIVVGLKLEETIRSYLDLQKENDNCKYSKSAKTYYSSLAQRAIKAQVIIDIFGFTVDQFGLLEMKSINEQTGGYALLQESFSSPMFKESFKKLFERDDNGDLRMGFAAKLQLHFSKELHIHGAIGLCNSLKTTGPQVSEHVIGEGMTTSWYLGGLDKCSTLAFYFDINNPPNQNIPNNKGAYIQFKTTYKHASGKTRLRVTTVVKKFSNPDNIYSLIPGFDQEAACILMARLAIFKAKKEESLDVIKWLDRSLIRIVAKFADYQKDDPNSFRLTKEFNLYPQFMYHLRRGNFVNTFGVSPDESAYFRGTLCRENATNSLVMIQPALLQYKLEDPTPSPVHLDIDSLQNNVVLLLDTYFNVIIWHGNHIWQWKEQGYHELPEYENLKTLLDQPQEDAKLIMEDRFPVPRLVITWPGHGLERFLKSRVNPSKTDANNTTVQSGNYITDDASLKLFMDHLVKLAVQSVN